jgi:hypothetical protein
MTSATEGFFEELGQRGHEPRVSMTSGTVRCDLTRDGQVDHWLVKIRNGDLAVSREDARADGVLQADAGLFDRIAAGEMNSNDRALIGAVVQDLS